MPDTTVKTVDRTTDILLALAKHGPSGAALADIAEETGISKATVHRLLLALVGVGFAFQELTTRKYRLGAVAVSLGGAALHQQIASAAQAILERIADASEDTVYASVREGLAAVCVARAVGRFPIRTLTLDVGSRRPLGVGAGSLALLAALPDTEVQQVVVRNAGWFRDFQEFSTQNILGLVQQTRTRGFALNEGRIVPGMAAIGVAVLDGNGRPLVSLSIAAIKERIGPDRLPKLLHLLEVEKSELEKTFRTDFVAA